LEEGKTKHKMEGGKQWRETVVYQERKVMRGVEMPMERGFHQDAGVRQGRNAGGGVYVQQVDVHQKEVVITDTNARVKFEDVKTPKPEMYLPCKLVVVTQVEVEEDSDVSSDSDDELAHSSDEADYKEVKDPVDISDDDTC
jgi:hypothetical protein